MAWMFFPHYACSKVQERRHYLSTKRHASSIAFNRDHRKKEHGAFNFDTS
ncbi:hypothetical protein Hanom_Chr17g01543541 [Helianthus anomalus]